MSIGLRMVNDNHIIAPGTEMSNFAHINPQWRQYVRRAHLSVAWITIYVQNDGYNEPSLMDHRLRVAAPDQVGRANDAMSLDAIEHSDRDC